MKNPFSKTKKETIEEIFDPQKERERIIRDTKLEEVLALNLPLTWEIYRFRLREFRIEDLDEPPERTWLDKLLPILPWIFFGIMFIAFLIKK